MPLTEFGREFFCKKIFARDTTTNTLDRFTGILNYYIDRIEVGNGTTPATESDTDLAAAAGDSNRQPKTIQPSQITYNNGQITIDVSFTNTEANFVWNETGIWATDGTNNRLIYRDNIENGTEKQNNQPRPRVLTFSI